MGDPLSITASVAGLLSFGLQATEYLYKYYTAYRDRDDNLAKTADRLDDLLQALQTIHDTLRARKWQPDEKTILQNIEGSIARCEDVINELQDEAKKLKKEPRDNFRNIIVAAGRRAAYPFRRSTLEKLDEDITDFRDNLSTALQALQLRGHQNIQNDIEEVKDIIKHAQAQHLAASVRQWLGAPDATIDYNAAFAKRHAGTGQWFIQSPAFTTWLQQDNSFLWLYGFAGSGKSVLCSTAIQHAFRHARSQPGSAVSFFFFTFNDDSKQDTSALLRALFLQLSGQVIGLDTDLTRLKDTYHHGTPPVPILIEYLRQAVIRCRHVYLLLDALDESPAETSRADVLSIINTVRGWRMPGLHLLVTSRDIVDIREGLHTEAQNMVALQNNNIEQDILRYVSYQVEHDRQLKRWGPHCETIKQHLTQRANGVFRWVECQLQPLRHCPKSKYDLEECLKQLPETLDETYERMLVGIARSCRERAQRILALLCFSLRPLTVPDVIDAIAVDIEVKRYNPDRKLENADDLLRICPGLIDITAHLSDDDNSPFAISRIDKSMIRTEIVRIAHFSVQEYLLSPRIGEGCAAAYAISETKGHTQISKTCLIYLCNQNFLNQALTRSLIVQYPFARYAAEFWHHHYRLVDINSATELEAWGLALLQTRAPLERWVRLHDVDEPWNEQICYDEEAKTYATPMYYASFLGLDDLLACILSKPAVDVNARGGRYGNALQAASYNGHERVVEILVDHGADVNAQGGRYGNALQAASYNGHERVVEILVDHGADVNAQGGRYGNALYAASVNGHEKIVQILVEHGADVNPQGGGYGNAVQAASYLGHEKVVQILVDHGADVNAQGGEYGSALYTASDLGHERVVQILVERDADVNAQGGRYGNALQAASYWGHEKVVQILVNAGANVNAQGGEYSNALYAASHRGYEKVVQILIENGADINSQGGEYGNALQAASASGYGKVVQILVDHGADINAQGGHFSNALHAASLEGHEKVVQILVDHGADVNAQGGWYGNALQAASERGHERVVQILVEHGADVDAREGEYGNALQAASWCGHEKVVQMLLDRGADVNARGADNGTPLGGALYKESSDVIRLLLQHGADPAKSACEISERLLLSGQRRSTPGLYCLSRCLVLLGCSDDARFCALLHQAACNICGTTIGGSCYVCAVCAIIDLCSTCFKEHNDGNGLRSCRDHNFIELSHPLKDDQVNQSLNLSAKSVRDWLQGLLDRFSQ